VTTASAVTKGFLFADLRDYSAFVESHGDQAAAKLLATYRQLVRSAIAAYDGAEIKTEGDSFYVVFPAASAAVEAGQAIVAEAAERSTAEAPIRVGVGIHAGETVATEEGLVGGAVNIAARVCAKAEAGEVLVTETVRALTRTYLPYRFVGLGSQSLKGIAGGIALYRVEAVPAGRLAHLRRRLAARRRQVTVLAGLLVVALVAAGGVYLVNRPPDCLILPTDTKNVVARIDPARDCVVQVIAVGRRPNSIVATDDAVWVANEGDWTVARIDLASHATTDWIGAPGAPISLTAHPDGQVDALAFDDRLWSGHRVVWIRDSGETFEVSYDLPEDVTGPGNQTWGQSPTAYSGLAAAGGWTWAVSGRGAVVRLIGQGSFGSVIEQADLSRVDVSNPGLVAAIGGTVWVADLNVPAIYRFEGIKTSPESIPLVGTRGTRALAATSTELWLLRQDGSLTRIDASVTGRNPVFGEDSLAKGQRTVALDVPATAIAVGPESLWLLDDVGRTVRSVDPASGHTVATVKVGGVPASAVFADGTLWVTIHAP
jgi:class 3 adenylate cyclase